MRTEKEAYISALKRVIISLQSRSDAHFNRVKYLEISSTFEGVKEQVWMTANAEYCAWNDVMLFAQQHLSDINEGRKEVSG
jgi:hypothetical protein